MGDRTQAWHYAPGAPPALLGSSERFEEALELGLGKALELDALGKEGVTDRDTGLVRHLHRARGHRVEVRRKPLSLLGDPPAPCVVWRPGTGFRWDPFYEAVGVAQLASLRAARGGFAEVADAAAAKKPHRGRS